MSDLGRPYAAPSSHSQTHETLEESHSYVSYMRVCAWGLCVMDEASVAVIWFLLEIMSVP